MKRILIKIRLFLFKYIRTQLFRLIIKMEQPHVPLPKLLEMS